MNYTEALKYIENIPKFCYPLGNDSLAEILDCMGNPETRLHFVHIVGTNGKGSAAAMLGEILKRSGLKTGVFTSPYIRRFNERIAADGAPIGNDELAAAVSSVAEICEKKKIAVSQFAFIFACALYFYDTIGADAVVLEAGMGGRLDATNAIGESLVTMIMSVGLDHTEYLGDTAEKIAAEKCGVIKHGGTVVAAKNSAAVMHVIEEFCEKQGARLIKAPAAEKTENGFSVGGENYSLALGGDFQAENAAAVLAAVGALRDKGIKIEESAVREGFAHCRHSARFEMLAKNLIVDGGHNPDGVRALCDSLDKTDGKKICVAAMMEDKAVAECAARLARTFDKAICCSLDMPRCMSAKRLCEIFAQNGLCADAAENPAEAVRRALKEADGGTVVVCGSLYLAGEFLNLYDNEQKKRKIDNFSDENTHKISDVF